MAAAALLAACSDGDTLLIEPPPPSSLTVFPTAAPEGLPGELRTLSFKVALGSTQPRDVVVNWRTEAGTATPGEDYYDASGEAVIAAGELETAIEVELLGDAPPEAAETFHLRVSTTANAAPTATSLLGTIANIISGPSVPTGRAAWGGGLACVSNFGDWANWTGHG